MMPAKRLTADFITRYRTVLKWQAVDLARRKGMRWASYAKLFQYLLLKLTHNRGHLTHLLTAHRYYPTKLLTDLVRREGHTISTTVHSLLPNTRLQDFTRVAASRTLILKTPDLRQDSIEKGVLLISFTDTSAYFDALTAYRVGDPAPMVTRLAEASFAAVANGRQLVDQLRAIRGGWNDRVTARRDSAAPGCVRARRSRSGTGRARSPSRR